MAEGVMQTLRLPDLPVDAEFAPDITTGDGGPGIGGLNPTDQAAYFEHRFCTLGQKQLDVEKQITDIKQLLLQISAKLDTPPPNPGTGQGGATPRRPPPARPGPIIPPRAPTDLWPTAYTPMPKRFCGNPSEYQQFMLQCEVHFKTRPTLFDTDSKKVNFILLLLDGDAFKWVAPYMERADPLLLNYVLFVAEFGNVFKKQYHLVSRRQELLDIKQGKMEVIAYVAHFSSLAAEAECSADMKISLFYRGLNDELREAIMMVDPLPTTLETFIGLALRLEHQIQVRKQRRGQMTRVSPLQVRSGTPPDRGEPMVLGAQRSLSNQEKNRRRANNLCLYCGKDGHFAAACPVKPQKGNAPVV